MPKRHLIVNFRLLWFLIIRSTGRAMLRTGRGRRLVLRDASPSLRAQVGPELTRGLDAHLAVDEPVRQYRQHGDLLGVDQEAGPARRCIVVAAEPLHPHGHDFTRSSTEVRTTF